MGSREVLCSRHDRTVIITGPWSGNSSTISRTFQPIVEVSVLTNKYNNRLRSPRWYQKNKKSGRAWDGTYVRCAITLELARAIIDTCAPHLELYQGDSAWYPMIRGGKPKNPRRGHVETNEHLSSEQLTVVNW